MIEYSCKTLSINRLCNFDLACSCLHLSFFLRKVDSTALFFVYMPREWLFDLEGHVPAVHSISKEQEQEVELLHHDEDYQRRPCHQTKGNVTF